MRLANSRSRSLAFAKHKEMFSNVLDKLGIHTNPDPGPVDRGIWLGQCSVHLILELPKKASVCGLWVRVPWPHSSRDHQEAREQL